MGQYFPVCSSAHQHHLLPLASMPLFLVLALLPFLALGHYGSDHHHAVGHTHHGCYPSPCHYNAHCRDGGTAVACVCRPGFIGDGINSCRPAPTQPPPPPRNPCIGACGYNAHCKVVNGVAACACPAGYSGNPAHHCHRHT